MRRSACRGPVSRREFMRVGALALEGMTLPQLAAMRAAARQPDPDTSVILFWMWGGPSHLETYDLKPEAPTEYRGPFRPIHTAVPGLDICEVYPLQAKLGDKISLVRSLHHTMSAHNDGSIEVLTGKTPARPDVTSQAISEHPDFGMIASKMRGPNPYGLPRYVGIPRIPFMTRPGYLGLSHQGFRAGDPAQPGYAPPNLTRPRSQPVSRFEARRSLLAGFDDLRRDLDRQGAMAGTGQVVETALHMLANPQIAAAFDIGREDPRLRDRYGRHHWGQCCLLARRLAEAGAGVITIDAMSPVPGDPRYFSWDDHPSSDRKWDLASAMRWRAPHLDQGLSALIEDVFDRGLDHKILIVAMGEFGRTPRIRDNGGYLGRDHWPDAQCALVSGGGLRMGQVVGSTNARGEYPKDRPLTPQDLLATIYQHLGIDVRREFTDFSGRPHPILNEGRPIAELS